MFDLISLVALQRELLENKKARSASNKETDSKKSGKFLFELIASAKEFLEKHIFVLDLQGISRLDNYYYRNFIDLTNEITDHKIKLQISSRKDLVKAKKSIEKKSTKKYDAFGLFGTGFALVSSLPDPEELEEEVNNTKLEQEDDQKMVEESSMKHEDEGKKSAYNYADDYDPQFKDKSRLKKRRFEIP